jgi:3-oxoacyl-[acyl-carrier protein] reductase
MSDFLLQLSQNPNARKLIKTIGLPIPMPEQLRRASGPWEERPLADCKVAVGAAPGAELADAVARTLAVAGAESLVAGDPELLASFVEPGEAYGRPATPIEADGLADGSKLSALVFDASGARSPAELRALYDFFHPLVGSVARSGRIVILSRPPSASDDPATAAAREALTGFNRSLAKEIGRKGATSQVIYVAPGAEDRVDPVLRFVLSPRSAFMSGQPLYIDAVAEAPADPPTTHVLANKVVLVTGAARGIGAATARLLAAEGAHVVCLDRPADDGPTSKIAREIGGSVLLCDVTDPDAPELIARALEDEHGGVDVVVHNAGVTRDKTLARMKEPHWDQAIDINLGAVVRINERLIDGVLRGGGRIICLSSIAGIAGNMGQTNYAASKAGLIGYVRALAPKLAGRGITVNAVAPGFIETRLTDAIPVVIREVGRRLSALGQGGQPEDIGQTITFLASPGASGLTGQVLRVCGGAFVGA